MNLKRLDVFKRIIDSGRRSKLLVGDEAAPFFTDWTGQFKTAPGIVLMPDSTEQVSKILQYCSQEQIPVVPQGGLTGLVGGGVPNSSDQIVLNMTRMDRILDVNPQDMIVSCEAGAILQNVEETIKDHYKMMMPIDLGAKGSCQLGGLVACNAGGVRFRRYGGLHQNCAGMEVVLADGMVLNLRSCLQRKDNTGLDLKHLFIGSEGTLGVITKVDIYTVHQPEEVSTVILNVDDWSNVVKVFEVAQRQLSSLMSAFEFWDFNSEALVKKHLNKQLRRTPGKFNILVEGHGRNLSNSFDNLLETLSEAGLISDAAIAVDESHCAEMWAIREGITESCAKEGKVFKYDISLPLSKMYNIVEMIKSKFGSVVNPLGFGHVGDGNLHLNVITKSDDQKLKEQVDRFVYDYCHRTLGSISAEHGIGQLKLAEYIRSVEPSKLFVSQLIKQQLDPFNIMNPGKLFPQSAPAIVYKQSV